MAPPDAADYVGLPPERILERGYFALRGSPLCGNDSWLGSTAVYFEPDKVLIVSANHGGEHLFDFPKSVDYLSLKRLLRK